MAKTSATEKNKRRAKMVGKFANRCQDFKNRYNKFVFAY